MLEYSHENPYEFTAHPQVKLNRDKSYMQKCVEVIAISQDFTNRIEDELKKASMMSNFYRYMLGKIVWT